MNGWMNECKRGQHQETNEAAYQSGQNPAEGCPKK